MKQTMKSGYVYDPVTGDPIKMVVAKSEEEWKEKAHKVLCDYMDSKGEYRYG